MIDLHLHPGKKFQDIFKVSKCEYLYLLNEMLDIVETFYGYLLQMEYKAHISNSTYSGKVQHFIKHLCSIKEDVPKVKMKCLVLGSNLVGKSSLINAMLGINLMKINTDNIPQSSNVIQVEGTVEDNASLKLLNKESPSNERTSLRIDSLHNIEDIIDKDLLNDMEIILQVKWPVKNCPYLGLDSSIIEMPGLDQNEQMIKWLNHPSCIANSFIFVINGSGGYLNHREKLFLRQIVQADTKALLLCVVNLWDCVSADNSDADTTFMRNMLLEEFVNLMVKELQIWTINEIHDRVFFLSAHEMGFIRFNNFTLTECKAQCAKGCIERTKEFMRFEEVLWTLTCENCVWKDLRYQLNEVKDISSSILNLLKEMNSILASERDIISSAMESRANVQKKLTSIQEELKKSAVQFIESQSKTVAKYVKQLIMRKIWLLEKSLNEIPCDISTLDALVPSLKRVSSNFIQYELVPSLEQDTVKYLESVVENSRETLSELYLNRFGQLKGQIDVMTSANIHLGNVDSNNEISQLPSMQISFQVNGRSSCMSGQGLKLLLRHSMIGKALHSNDEDSGSTITTPNATHFLLDKCSRRSTISADSKNEHFVNRQTFIELQRGVSSHSTSPSMIFSLNACLGSIFDHSIDDFSWKRNRLEFQFSLSLNRLHKDTSWDPHVQIYRKDARFVVRMLPVCSTRYLFASGLGLSLLMALKCWRTLTVIGGAAGGLYLYEYSTWSLIHMKQKLIRKFSRHMYLMTSSRIDFLLVLISKQFKQSMRSIIQSMEMNIDRAESDMEIAVTRLLDLEDWAHKNQLELFDLNNRAMAIDNRLVAIFQSQCNSYMACCYRALSVSCSQYSI